MGGCKVPLEGGFEEVQAPAGPHPLLQSGEDMLGHHAAFQKQGSSRQHLTVAGLDLDRANGRVSWSRVARRGSLWPFITVSIKHRHLSVKDGAGGSAGGPKARLWTGQTQPQLLEEAPRPLHAVISSVPGWR